MGRVSNSIARLAIATALCTAVVPLPASAQGTLSDSLSAKMNRPQNGQDRLLVEAQELVYDNDKGTVSARGNAELYYQGRTLQADRVIYDRNSGRVFAEGNARLTEADGKTVATGDRFELTDDFKSGFIDSLRVEQDTVDQGKPVKTRFSAPRAERIEGETTVFERGTYTACEPCAKDPTRPPFWQVKAARIIHNNAERTIYYENASLEFLGVPVAYIPYFWSPDPTVKRKTGFLAPNYFASGTLGYGLTTPFFWNLAPNYDLTLRPTFYSRQGVLGQVEWRHRLLTGSYSIRAAGIFQQDKTAFLPGPFGPGDKDFRGSIESVGKFYLNERWTAGWDISLLSDKWFLTNYRIRSDAISTNYFRESISQVYLVGQGERSWFEARGYYFKGLSSYDWQKQQAVVHPVVDYIKRWDGPGALGGEVTFESNLTSLTREAAQFQGLRGNGANLFLQGYETCAVFSRGICLVRGIGGNTNRLSSQLSWRRQIIDGVGGVWQPFAFMRADVFSNSLNTTNYQNAQQLNYLTRDETTGRLMPGVGVEYRMPLVGELGGWGTQIVEPIVQVVARTNETRIGRLPNEDAQSLIFDDTNLFDWNKFSGYDRIEGGVRANYGLQYSVLGRNGFYANALFGQSYQLGGRNSYSPGDIANVGRDSGLETRASDYVGRLTINPSSSLTFSTRARFDQDTFALKRVESTLGARIGMFSPSLTYARYDAQPELGQDRRREGLLASMRVNLSPNWYVSGSALLDLDRYLLDRENFIRAYQVNPATAVYNSSGTTLASMSLGAGYEDECTTLSVVYTSILKDNSSGEKERNQTIMLRLELRTLGQASVSQAIGSGAEQDGVASNVLR